MSESFRVGSKCIYNVYKINEDGTQERFAVTFEFEDGPRVVEALNHMTWCPHAGEEGGS